MLNFFVGFVFGIFSVIIFSVLKISSKCSREEEKEDFGQIAYNEIEKREISKKEN